MMTQPNLFECASCGKKVSACALVFIEIDYGICPDCATELNGEAIEEMKEEYHG